MKDNEVEYRLSVIYLLIKFSILGLAAVVAYSGNDGWGWLIFASLCTKVSINCNKEDKEND